ncbi:hypothetical protein, partial [Streptomyces glomeratus]|uniref:hypothetical protein n=1 Tax=Streptomyces glomeratus TaxID=284452 RepID=UPI0031D12C74
MGPDQTLETSSGNELGPGESRVTQLPAKECIEVPRTIQVNEFRASCFISRPSSFKDFLGLGTEWGSLNSQCLKAQINSLNSDIEHLGYFLIGKSVSVKLQQ